MHFHVKKYNLDIFIHAIPVETLPQGLMICPQAEGNYTYPPRQRFFLKICFLHQQKEGIMVCFIKIQ